MAFDAHTNLAVSTIATAPAPATSGTTLTVAVGEGARFPAAPFNVTVWPATALPTPVNAEVVRVTARTGDVLTITRAQEGTTARSIVAGDLVAATITAKTITDIESGVNFPALTAAGQVAGSHFYSTAGLYYLGAAGSMAGSSDGVWRLLNAASDGFDRLQFGGTTNAYPALKRSGAGLAVRLANDSGNADLTANGATFTSTVLVGATPPNPSYIALLPTGQFRMALAGASGLAGDFFTSGTSVLAGSIALSGGTTAYNTTSDARLKTDHGRHTDPDVLRRTIVHAFTWDHDGLPGRGVFAQEAVTVAPFAVTVGTDDRNESGNLAKPWGVDYSKYVPDLIVGWQDHDAKIDHLLEALEANVALVERLTAVARRPSVYQRIRTFINGLWPAWVTP